MTFRYNPQSIEKQVRKWPVLFSEKDLHKDLCKRVSQLLGKSDTSITELISPFQCELPFDEEMVCEYGIDACRLAAISSGKQSKESLLESSFKWLAKLHNSFEIQATKEFNPIPWLEAAIQLEDHIIKRNCDHLALALVMKAFKDSAPNNELSESERLLVAAAIQPFAPIYSSAKILLPERMITLPEILDIFKDYLCIKVALERGGWHWQVFSKSAFESNSQKELIKIKWIQKAVKNQNITIKEEDGGIRVCFS